MAQDPPAGVAEDVQKLIAEHITSIEQLEILLLLAARPEVEWSPEQVSAEMRTSNDSATSRLEDLRARGFLASPRPESASRYRFQPSTEWLRHAVELLAVAYRERRYTVIDLIFSKPIDRLRVYADAFRFRKSKANG